MALIILDHISSCGIGYGTDSTVVFTLVIRECLCIDEKKTFHKLRLL